MASKYKVLKKITFACDCRRPRFCALVKIPLFLLFEYPGVAERAVNWTFIVVKILYILYFQVNLHRLIGGSSGVRCRRNCLTALCCYILEQIHIIYSKWSFLHTLISNSAWNSMYTRITAGDRSPLNTDIDTCQWLPNWRSRVQIPLGARMYLNNMNVCMGVGN